jgi:hypothetical protein
MIEIELTLKDNEKNTLLYYQVLNQSECITRGSGVLFTSSNGFTFESGHSPGIYGKCICIRGDNPELDSKVACVFFYSVGRRMEWINSFKVAFKEFKLFLTGNYVEKNEEEKLVFSAYED